MTIYFTECYFSDIVLLICRWPRFAPSVKSGYYHNFMCI